MKRDQRGSSLIWSIIVFVLIVMAIFVVCDAAFDDEDEVDDLGQGVELSLSD